MLLYLVLALVFFLPFVLIMSDIGAELRRDGCGIYTWASRYLGARLTFVGAFIWYLSCIILIGNCISYAIHYLSIFICGDDLFLLSRFELWSKSGLTTVVAVLATIIAIKWHSHLRLIITIGGAALICAILVLLLASVPLLLLVDGSSALASHLPLAPRSGFEAASRKGEYAQLVVQIVFAYCCISIAGGLTNIVQNVGKALKKKLVLAVIVVAIGYAVSVLLWGTQPAADGYWIPSIFELTKNMGASWGVALHLSSDSVAAISSELLHITGLLLFLAAVASVLILIYAPLRLLMRGIQETAESTNTAGVPAKAMWVQCLLVLIVLNVSREQSYYLLDTLTQVLMTLPCLLLAVAFFLFKTKLHSEVGSEIPKSRLSALLISGTVVLVIILSNVSAAVLPAVYLGEFERAKWAFYGGAVAVLAGLVAYEIYCRRISKKQTPEA